MEDEEGPQILLRRLLRVKADGIPGRPIGTQVVLDV